MTPDGDIRINLLEQETAKIGEYMKTIGAVVLVMIVSAALMIYYFDARAQVYSLEAANEQLKLKYTRSLETLAQMEKSEDSLSRLKKKEKVVFLIENNTHSIMEVLAEIENCLPSEATLIELEIGPKLVMLKGFAPAYRNAAQMLSGLREGLVMKELALLSCRYDEQLNQVEFELMLKWEDDPY